MFAALHAFPFVWWMSEWVYYCKTITMNLCTFCIDSSFSFSIFISLLAELSSLSNSCMCWLLAATLCCWSLFSFCCMIVRDYMVILSLHHNQWSPTFCTESIFSSSILSFSFTYSSFFSNSCMCWLVSKSALSFSFHCSYCERDMCERVHSVY